MENQEAIARVQHWLSSMVIGLGLCPFAEKVFKSNSIRYTMCTGSEPRDLLQALAVELRSLAQAPRSQVETTLLIAPSVLPDFLDFNDFVGEAEKMLGDLGLSGTIQVVGFHPAFQFADTNADAPENYTNRSPFPMLHLLREESISELESTEEELLQIPQRNIQTLRRLGLSGVLERLALRSSR